MIEPFDLQKIHQYFGPLLEGVEAAALERFWSAGEQIQCAPGAVLLEQRSDTWWFFLLATGTVKIIHVSREGVESVAKLLGAPAAFGETECLAERPSVVTVVAIDRSKVFRFPPQALLALVRESHVFCRNLLHDLAARFYLAQQNAQALAFDPIEPRLARILRDYVTLFGLPVEEGTLIRVPLSQDALANSIGAGRRSVTRTLMGWEDLGLLSKRGRCFVIRDLERLESLCVSDAYRISYRAGAKIK